MMVTDFVYVGDFLNVLNQPPTSQTCHQHIWSPTSVTNIDVTEFVFCPESGLLIGFLIINPVLKNLAIDFFAFDLRV